MKTMDASDLFCPHHGIHLWLPSAARKLRFRGYDEQETVMALVQLTRGARRLVPEREIRSGVKLVFGTEPEMITAHAPKIRYESDKLERFASQAPAVDENFFQARSKYTCCNRSPLGTLAKLFKPGEKLLIFDRYKSQGQLLWQVPPLNAGDFRMPRQFRENLQGDQDGIWFLSSPVDGSYYQNPREENKLSRRSQESITRYPYIVIESDKAPRDLWLRALARLPLPIAMITDSGGISIHSLVRIDAVTKQEWDQKVTTIKPVIVTLGADPGALTAVRLTRLPNCFRAAKNSAQRLLYLDDNPDQTPILWRRPRL
jgi:hypothetical protein